jgi:predicted SprT family Zn-dependent metalloprotease
LDIREADNIARTLMRKHGLGHWELKWNNSKRVAGSTYHFYWNANPHVSRGRFTLSREWFKVMTDEECIDTILHEIAHGLINHLDEDIKPHGPEWKAKAISIGCSGRRCVDPNSDVPDSKYTGICEGGHIYPRHRMTNSMKIESLYCTRCSTEDHKAYIKWLETANYKKGFIPSFAKVDSAPRTLVQSKVTTTPSRSSWAKRYEQGYTMLDDYED